MRFLFIHYIFYSWYRSFLRFFYYKQIICWSIYSHIVFYSLRIIFFFSPIISLITHHLSLLSLPHLPRLMNEIDFFGFSFPTTMTSIFTFMRYFGSKWQTFFYFSFLLFYLEWKEFTNVIRNASHFSLSNCYLSTPAQIYLSQDILSYLFRLFR